MDRSRYPHDWDAIALKIKTEAGWTCQNCGKPCRKPGETKHELSKRLKSTAWISDLFERLPEGGWLIRAGRFTLTVAHLNHRPSDCRPENLRAWCAPCHCRYDNTPAAKAQKKQLKLEYLGQLRLF